MGDNQINENKKDKKNIVGGIYLFGVIIPMILGVIVLLFTHTRFSVPIAVLSFCIIIFSICGIILAAMISPEIDPEKKKNKNTILKVISNILIVVVIGVGIFFSVKYSVKAVKDMAEEPKRVELSLAYIKQTSPAGKSRTRRSTLYGRSENGQEKFGILGNIKVAKLQKRLKESKNITVYYHRNLNIIYKYE